MRGLKTNIQSKDRISSVLKFTFLSIYAAATISPFIWVLISSLKTDNEIYANPFGLPAKLIFKNYKEAWVGAQVGQSFFNSLLYSVLSVVCVILLASMTSYVLARVRPSKWMYLFFTLGIMVPVHSVIIPLLIFLRSLGMVNTRPGIILAYIVSNLSFSIFVLVAFMRTLPKDVEEAARIDGCKRVRMFFSIIIPISKPGLATIGTFAFLNSWNDLLLSMVLTSSPHLRTLNLSCFNLRGQYVQRYALICAGLVVLIIPVSIMYMLFQEQVIKGMTAGAVKG